MNGFDLLKYLIDTMYEHWLITALFLIFICPWNHVNIVAGGKKKNEQ